MNTQIDWTPQVDMKFDTLKDAWKQWKNYGKQIGFGVRKKFINKSKFDGKVTSRGYVCCKEGVRGVGKHDHFYTSCRDEIKTDCYARLYLTLLRETRKYKVYDFIVEHNHILHLQETVHMMRSHREMSEVQTFAIDLACASGITHKATHALMSREASGRANLRYTELDQKNYLQTRRQKNLIHD